MTTTDRRLAAVWAVLVVVTVVSVGVHVGLGAGPIAALVVLALAFGKAWLVGRWFMELRAAPAGLRRLFDGYMVLMPVMLAGIVLIGS